MICFTKGAIGQSVRDSLPNKFEIDGTWQQGDSIVGSGLGQNFIFYPNGKFELNFVTEKEDQREIVKIKETYRMKKDLKI